MTRAVMASTGDSPISGATPSELVLIAPLKSLLSVASVLIGPYGSLAFYGQFS